MTQNYDEYLELLSLQEESVARKRYQLRLAEKQLDKTLRLIEDLFSEKEECVIEIMENGKWEEVGKDKNDPRGFSAEVPCIVYKSKDEAKKSGIYRRLLNSKDLIEGKDFRINDSNKRR